MCPCENLSFHQDRPPEVSSKYQRSHDFPVIIDIFVEIAPIQDSQNSKGFLKKERAQRVKCFNRYPIFNGFLKDGRAQRGNFSQYISHF